MSTPSVAQVRKRIDAIQRVSGLFLREYSWVNDWADTPGGKGSQAAIEKVSGKSARQASQWQDQTGDVAVSNAKARARGKQRLAAKSLQRGIDELRAGFALLEDAMAERMSFDQASRAAEGQRKQYPTTISDDDRAALRDAQRRRDARGEGVPA